MAIYIDDDFPGELRTSNGSKNYKYEMNYTRQFQVRTTSLGDNSETVLYYMQIYQLLYIGRQHPDNPYAYCTDISWVAGEPDRDGARIWIVTYEYGTFPQEMIEPSPLLRPYTIDWDSESVDSPICRDFSSDVYESCKDLNTTAGTPFDPPVTRPLTNSILRIVRNEPINTYNEEVIQNYRWTVNNAEWDVWIPTSGTVSPRYITIPPRCALCTSVKPTRQFSQTLQILNSDATMGYYNEVEYVFSLKFEFWGEEAADHDAWVADDIGQGHDKRILNKSYMYTNIPGGTQRRALDENGYPTADAIFLDKNGAKSSTPTYRTFQIYARQNFDDFGFTVPA